MQRLAMEGIQTLDSPHRRKRKIEGDNNERLSKRLSLLNLGSYFQSFFFNTLTWSRTGRPKALRPRRESRRESRQADTSRVNGP